jgi:hypothetical protein
VTPLLALALAAAPGCGTALADAGRLSPEALAARAPALVERLAADGAGGPTTALERAASSLAAASPASPPVDAQALTFRAALARHCALANAPPVAGATAGDRAELAAILARPELTRPRGDPYALRRALLAIRDWVLDLLGTSEAERYASLGRALFLAGAAVAGLLAVAALRRRARRAAPASAQTGEGRDSAALTLGGDAARAEEALRRGDAREALRYAFLAALETLERSGGMPGGRALTNGEIVASLGATSTAGSGAAVHPERSADAEAPARSRRASTSTMPTPIPLSTRDDLVALAAAFDRAVYGGVPVGAEDARAAVERARRVAARGWRA